MKRTGSYNESIQQGYCPLTLPVIVLLLLFCRNACQTVSQVIYIAGLVYNTLNYEDFSQAEATTPVVACMERMLCAGLLISGSLILRLWKRFSLAMSLIWLISFAVVAYRMFFLFGLSMTSLLAVALTFLPFSLIFLFTGKLFLSGTLSGAL